MFWLINLASRRSMEAVWLVHKVGRAQEQHGTPKRSYDLGICHRHGNQWKSLHTNLENANLNSSKHSQILIPQALYLSSSNSHSDLIGNNSTRRFLAQKIVTDHVPDSARWQQTKQEWRHQNSSKHSQILISQPLYLPSTKSHRDLSRIVWARR